MCPLSEVSERRVNEDRKDKGRVFITEENGNSGLFSFWNLSKPSLVFGIYQNQVCSIFCIDGFSRNSTI
jgi:hypothetical protein